MAQMFTRLSEIEGNFYPITPLFEFEDIFKTIAFLHGDISEQFIEQVELLQETVLPFPPFITVSIISYVFRIRLRSDETKYLLLVGCQDKQEETILIGIASLYSDTFPSITF